MYTQSITRSHRTAFILAIDCSGSMAERIVFHGRSMRKADAVAQVANRLLFELTERARRTDGIRDYYDVAVPGYSGRGGKPLLGERPEFLSVVEIDRMAPAPATVQGEYRLPDGSTALLDELPVPAWIVPEAQGETPMYDALLHVRDLAAEWTQRPENAGSFPPVVFNITDGEATDCNDEELLGICRRIRSLRTDDGSVLLINIHIASGCGQRALLFPTADEAGYGRPAAATQSCSTSVRARCPRLSSRTSATCGAAACRRSGA